MQSGRYILMFQRNLSASITSVEDWDSRAGDIDTHSYQPEHVKSHSRRQ